ncbi:MAG: glycosyltransferase family 1 protein [Paludibacter sp.]
MKKKVLVDLSSLKDIYCGLGQVALAYGKYFQENYKREEAHYLLTLLLPKKMFGMFGNEVEYIDSKSWFAEQFLLRFRKFDIWHSVHQLSRFKPKFKSTKYILTVHDLNYLYERTGNRKRRRHDRIQRKINRADEIICISEFVKSEVENNLELNGKQCKVIYNGVETLEEILALKPKAEFQLPFFFSVGVILKKKNFHVLLDMMKLMPDKHLYIAGKDAKLKRKNGYAVELRRRIEDEGIMNVSLLGAVSHKEKIWLYKNCEAFLFPSLFEGFGLPIIEAMQFGKPVFSSKETSLKEIGGNFAYFWDDFEPNSMKDKITDNLLEFYKNKEIAEAEKQYAYSFSYEKHFEQYEKLYNEL